MSNLEVKNWGLLPGPGKALESLPSTHLPQALHPMEECNSTTPDVPVLGWFGILKKGYLCLSFHPQLNIMLDIG
jgi:hypothetical protein